MNFSVSQEGYTNISSGMSTVQISFQFRSGSEHLRCCSVLHSRPSRSAAGRLPDHCADQDGDRRKSCHLPIASPPDTEVIPLFGQPV